MYDTTLAWLRDDDMLHSVLTVDVTTIDRSLLSQRDRGSSFVAP